MAGTAFSAQAMTYGVYANQSNDPLVKMIDFSLHKTMNALQDIPLRTINTLKQIGTRWTGNLPGVNWGGLNTVPTVVIGKPTQYSETAYRIINQFQIDRRLMNEVNQIENPLDAQIKAWLEAFTYDFNMKIINNGHPGKAVTFTTSGFAGNSIAMNVNDPNAIVGYRARLDNPGTYGVVSECLVSGGSININSSISQTNGILLIAYIQNVLDNMNAPEGDDVVMYMSELFKRQFEASIRIAGAGAGWSIDRDAFGRSVTKYRNAVIRVAGRRVDQTTAVIFNSETTAGADPATATSANAYSSIYFVKYGTGSFAGWQTEALKPIFLGLDPTNGVAYNAAIDWAIGQPVLKFNTQADLKSCELREAV